MQKCHLPDENYSLLLMLYFSFVKKLLQFQNGNWRHQHFQLQKMSPIHRHHHSMMMMLLEEVDKDEFQKM